MSKVRRSLLVLFGWAALALSAQTNSNSGTEAIRNEILQGRRIVCGRVLQVTPDGLVVDSGYPVLLEPPLNRAWVHPAGIAPARPEAMIEANAPDAIAVGLVFLVDYPKRPAVHQDHYVALHTYPAGKHEYVPVAGLTNKIREFSAGLDTAIRLHAEANQPRERLFPRAYLNMPDRADGPLPALLSQTGAFQDTRHLVAIEGLMPYSLNVPFWSDGASKSRWMSLPNAKISFAPRGEWKFPPGTVFVKHFELADDETQPQKRRRLETRLLVCARDGSVYGATYKWRADESDADLLATNLSEDISIHTAGGGTRTQTWYYPSRQDCVTCHTEKAGGVLGVKTRQFNRAILTDWNRLGLFEPAVTDAALAQCQFLAPSDDTSRSLEDRARSYLDANCSQCHRPGGTVAYFDARFDTPLDHQGLVDGSVIITEGIDRARVIAPNDIWRSILFQRANATDASRMPPIARMTTDRAGTALLRQWIESLGGRPTVPPPDFSLPAGNYPATVDVKLTDADPKAEIRYTLDGSIPGTDDPLLEGEIHLTNSATLRAKAFRDGYTRSITAQETFILGGQ